MDESTEKVHYSMKKIIPFKFCWGACLEKWAKDRNFVQSFAKNSGFAPDVKTEDQLVQIRLDSFPTKNKQF